MSIPVGIDPCVDSRCTDKRPLIRSGIRQIDQALNGKPVQLPGITVPVHGRGLPALRTRGRRGFVRHPVHTDPQFLTAVEYRKYLVYPRVLTHIPQRLMVMKRHDAMTGEIPVVPCRFVSGIYSSRLPDGLYHRVAQIRWNDIRNDQIASVEEKTSIDQHADETNCIMMILPLYQKRRLVSLSSVRELFSDHPVVPVITLTDPGQSLPLAAALLDGGIRVMEITLRSDAGLQGIERIRKEIPDMIVGAGTVRTAADLADCARAGACFAVSPGSSPGLLSAAAQSDMPFLPGAMTPSEIMSLAEAGYTEQKLFPANAHGGMEFLRSLQGPLGDISFCVSGGIHAGNSQAWLELPNVFCVAGSWLAPGSLLDAGDCSGITRLVQEFRS